MKYDAFISYKHAPLDLEIAKKVHKTLENYHIPKAVQKRTGMKRINRVFRDQEELMVGSDLDGKIEEALKNSVYLIVICSPRTPESIWVQKEIDSFIKLHGRERIMTVLIEGEPNESFPKALLVDDNGKPVEPLAADIRGRDKKERDSKFKIEFLRLAAALIGCSFDDLKQRHREHRIRQTMFIIAGAAAVLVTFGAIFSGYNAATAKRMKALAEERKKLMEETERLADDYKDQLLATQINQSKFYAKESADLLANGNREDAVLVAAEGLPGENRQRPFVSEAEYALSRALYAYSDGSYWDYDRILPHSATVNKKNISPDETRLATLDASNTVRVYDTSTWDCLFEFFPGSTDDVYVYALASGTDCVFIGCKNTLFCYDFDGNILYQKDGFNRIVNIVADEIAGKLFINTYSDLYILDYATGSELFAYRDEGDDIFFNERVCYNSFCNLWLVENDSMERGSSFFLLVHTDTLELSRIDVSGEDIYKMEITGNGNIAVMSGNQFLMDHELKSVTVDLYSGDGEKRWSKELDFDLVDLTTFSTTLISNSFSNGVETKHEVIAVVEYFSFTLNEQTGAIERTITLPGSVKGLFFEANTSVGNVLIKGGSVIPVNFDSGAIFEGHDFNIGNVSATLTPATDFLILQTYSTDLIIICGHVGKDYNVVSYNSDPGTGLGTAPDDKYFVMQNGYDYKRYDFFSPEGDLIYTAEKETAGIPSCCFRDEYFYIVATDTCYEINPLKQTTVELSSGQYGIKYCLRTCISGNGNYLLFLSNDGAYKVIDLTDGSKKVITEGTASETFMKDSQGGFNRNFSKALLSNDGKTLYIFLLDSPLIKLDLQSGEVTQLDTEKYLKGDAYATITAMSDDGNYIAFNCEKNRITVYDVKNEKTYSVIEASGVPYFMQFVKGDSTLMIQGSDTMIHFFDIASKEFINYSRPGEAITSVTEDTEDGLLAVCTGNSIQLYNEEDFGILANVEHGTAFFRGNNLFFLGGSTKHGTLPYKNYKILLDEAKEAFPFSALSDEKKVKYNIT